MSRIEGSGNLFFCIGSDITERRRTENALKESETFLNRVFESIRDGISVLDRDMNIIRVNRVMEEWYPHAVTLQGKKCYAVYHGRKEPCEGCPSLKAIESETTVSAVRPFQSEGGEIKGWLEVSAYPLLDERGVSGVIEHVRDISARRQAEAALRESELTKAVLMDGIPESMLLLDRNGIILDANTVLAQKLHRDRADLIGARAYDFIDPGNARFRKDKIEEVFRTGRQVIFEDTRAGVCFENTVTPVLSMDGRVEKVAIIAFDITGRKRAETALQDAKQQAELYLDLLGHDINNMHQIALGYLELAQSRHPEARHQEFLNKPIEVLQRSSRLIQNVRKLQKLRENTPELVVVDVIEVLRDVRHEYGESSGKTLTLDLKGQEHCPVRANELLRDVFENLVSNAVKHTGDGTEISITLETTMEKDGSYCRISVEDNGPGIPDHIKDRVFGRSMKGATGAKGMGLGLYLVRSLVDSYGGQVSVTDRIPGDHTQGARFVVRLPVASQ
jgi:PAS domain S-box-containing protein